jgi:hypothetical protein
MAKLVHLQILLKKLDALTNEDFHHYFVPSMILSILDEVLTTYRWQFEHPKTWLSVDVVKKKVVKYTQLYVDHTTW